MKCNDNAWVIPPHQWTQNVRAALGVALLWQSISGQGSSNIGWQQREHNWCVFTQQKQYLQFLALLLITSWPAEFTVFFCLSPPLLYFPGGRGLQAHTCLQGCAGQRREQPSAVHKPRTSPLDAHPALSSWCWPLWISIAVTEGAGSDGAGAASRKYNCICNF